VAARGVEEVDPKVKKSDCRFPLFTIAGRAIVEEGIRQSLFSPSVNFFQRLGRHALV